MLFDVEYLVIEYRDQSAALNNEGKAGQVVNNRGYCGWSSGVVSDEFGPVVGQAENPVIV